MTLSTAVVIVAVVYGAYRLAGDYIRRSMRSFASAQRAWSELSTTAKEIVEQDIPEPAARAVIGLAGAAGCGCFIRGVMAAHYLPGLLRRSVDEPGDWDQAFTAIGNLSIEQKRSFDRLLALVLVYDSFKNPLQGWFFRRMLRSYVDPEPTFAEKAETQLAAFSVLSRRQLLAR